MCPHVWNASFVYRSTMISLYVSYRCVYIHTYIYDLFKKHIKRSYIYIYICILHSHDDSFICDILSHTLSRVGACRGSRATSTARCADVSAATWPQHQNVLLWRVVVCYGVLRCVAVCCGVLQCVVVCCCVLLCVAVCCGVLQCVAVWCSMLRCVVVCNDVQMSPQQLGLNTKMYCYYVLQCVVVCCGVLRCVAVFCSVL